MRGDDPRMMGGVYGMVCPYCGGAIGSFGPHICSTPPAPVVQMTDTEIEEMYHKEVDGWTKEKQIIVYRYLNMEPKHALRIGSSLDHQLSEERRKRHLAEKQA